MDLLEQERKEKADIAIFFAAINEKSRDKLTPFLSDPKFNVNVKNSQGVPALLVAAKNGWFEGCELLLRHPQIEVNEQQKTMTTLHTLVLTIPKTPTQIAYLETVVELLISKGMDIDYQNEKKDTALHKALKMKNNPAIAILLKKGANFHIENQDGETALHIVIRNNDEATAKLLSKLFSINRQTRKKYDSYVVAILDRLFPQLPDKRKEEFFINAVAQDFLNQVRYFVDKKMDVNLYSPKEEKSLLEIAASEGHYATFTFLLNQPNIVVTRLGEWINKTAFYLIKKPPQTQTETLKLINLLRRLVKPKTIDIPNPRGETLVHEAAFRGNLAALNILLDLGASTSVRTIRCETAFHYALRAPPAVRATVFETLMRRFKGPPEALQKYLHLCGPEGDCYTIVTKYGLKDVAALLSVPIATVLAQGWEKDYPPELFLRIFSYLMPRECSSLPLVCRTFRQILTSRPVNEIRERRNLAKIIISHTSERYKKLAEELTAGERQNKEETTHHGNNNNNNNSDKQPLSAAQGSSSSVTSSSSTSSLSSSPPSPSAQLSSSPSSPRSTSTLSGTMPATSTETPIENSSKDAEDKKKPRTSLWNKLRFSVSRFKKVDKTRHQTPSLPPQTQVPLRSLSLMNEPNFDYLFRIIVIGDPDVGKRSLVYRFAAGAYPPPPEFAKQQWEFKTRLIRLPNEVVKLQIWTSSNPLVRSKTGSHPGQFPRGDLILLAFSLTSADNISDTLQKLHSWQALAQERMPHSPIILVGCKADLHHEDQTYEKAKDFAANCNFAHYFDCSAKDDLNVDIIFYFAAKLLCDIKKSNPSAS